MKRTLLFSAILLSTFATAIFAFDGRRGVAGRGVGAPVRRAAINEAYEEQEGHSAYGRMRPGRGVAAARGGVVAGRGAVGRRGL